MRILLIGSGGREYVLAWKLSQSPRCEALYIAPGNAGTSSFGQNIQLDVETFIGLNEFITEQAINLVVVGPEAPLVAGIYDHLRETFSSEQLIIIGPSAAGALLEGSKAFAKAFMARHGIPTAAYFEAEQDNLQEAIQFMTRMTPPIVLKADGLAAGKGVLIIDTLTEACDELKAMLQGKFGRASARVVIEEFLPGIEFSAFVLTNGKSYVVLPEAKDYKRIGEQDTGLNTGGMGAVSPVPFVDAAIMEKVEKRIVFPTIHGLKNEGLVYEGFIFFGLMLCGDDPYVIEYNCRLGDPETEVIIPRIRTDLVELFQNMDRLEQVDLVKDSRFAATVMAVSGGYPGPYTTGAVIHGLDPAPLDDTLIVHAGTRQQNDQVLTAGGRVLTVTGLDASMTAALDKAYTQMQKIHFNGMYYRRDIGQDLKKFNI